MSDSSLSSLSSLSEDENVNIIHHIPTRNFPFDSYDEHDFKARFRFSKHSVMEFLELFAHRIQPLTNRSKSISAMNQLLITLRYYATGAFQQVIGDTFNIHKSTICRVIKKVSTCICQMKERFISMPTEQEINQVVLDFYSIAGFPRTIGAVDCTHIRISSPGGPNAELYRNRKSYFSLNVQVICDATLKIRHVIARWPGSVHDSTIFNNSPLPVLFTRGDYGQNVLLGDNGYPCRSYLLTPFLNPANASETAYNRAHIKSRNAIERCFGLLKRRFPCLHSGMSLKTETVLQIIVACMVLHNLGIMLRDEPENPVEIRLEEVVGIDNIQVLDAAARQAENTAVRRALVETVFTA